MVMRKLLLATAGSCRICVASVSRFSSLRSMPGSSVWAGVVPSRRSLGDLPNSTLMSMSTAGGSPGAASFRCSASVTVPTTAIGQRSRVHRASSSGSRSGAMPST